MMSSIVITEHENAIHITLNRPEALNALNHEMVLEITRLLKKYETDDNVSEVVFKGAGDRAFCAGGDINPFILRDWKTPKPPFNIFTMNMK